MRNCRLRKSSEMMGDAGRNPLCPPKTAGSDQTSLSSRPATMNLVQGARELTLCANGNVVGEEIPAGNRPDRGSAPAQFPSLAK